MDFFCFIPQSLGTKLKFLQYIEIGYCKVNVAGITVKSDSSVPCDLDMDEKKTVSETLLEPVCKKPQKVQVSGKDGNRLHTCT